MNWYYITSWDGIQSILGTTAVRLDLTPIVDVQVLAYLNG